MLVSVVMAVYNGERFLRECIESVLGQTFRDFEFIIVDDGSTDSSAAIISEFAKRDPRVILLRQENRGVAAAANAGLSAARGELIARMDSDDRMLPHRLEKQIEFLNAHPEAAVVCGWAYFIDASGRRMRGASKAAVDVEQGWREFNPSRFVEIIQSTVLMRRKDVMEANGYRDEMTYCEDRDLWGRMVAAGKIIRCQTEYLLEFRLHSGAMTMQKAYRNSKMGLYINMNIVRLMKHEQPLSRDDFENWYKSRSLWHRLNDKRRFWALFHFKNATRHLAERRWGRFAGAILLAFSLRPLFMARRVIAKLA